LENNKKNEANQSKNLLNNSPYIISKARKDLNEKGTNGINNKNMYEINTKKEISITVNINNSDNKKEKDNHQNFKDNVDNRIKDKKKQLDKRSDKFFPKYSFFSQFKKQNIKNEIGISDNKLINEESLLKYNIQPLEKTKVDKNCFENRSDIQNVQANKRIVDLYNTTKEVNNIGLSDKQNVFLLRDKYQIRPNLDSSLNYLNPNKNKEKAESMNKDIRNYIRENIIDDHGSDVLNNIEINDESKSNSKNNKLLNDSKESFSFNNKINQSEENDRNIYHHSNKNGLLNNILQNININNVSKSRNIKKNANLFSQSKNCSSISNNKNSSYKTQLTQIDNLKEGLINSTNVYINKNPVLSNKNYNGSIKGSVLCKNEKPFNPQSLSHIQKLNYKKNDILKQIVMNNSNNIKSNLTNNNRNYGNNYIKGSTNIINPANHTYINMNLNLNINLEMDSKNFINTEVYEKNQIEKSSIKIYSPSFNSKLNNNLANNKKIIRNNNNNKINFNDKNPYNRSFQGSLLKNYQNNTSQPKNIKYNIMKKIPKNLNQDSFGVFNYVNHPVSKILENDKNKILYTDNLTDNRDINNLSSENNNFNKQNKYLLNIKSLANKKFKENSKLDFYSNKISYLKTSIPNNKSAQIGFNSLIHNDSQLSFVNKKSIITSEISQNENNKPIIMKGNKIFNCFYSNF